MIFGVYLPAKLVSRFTGYHDIYIVMSFAFYFRMLFSYFYHFLYPLSLKYYHHKHKDKLEWAKAGRYGPVHKQFLVRICVFVILSSLNISGNLLFSPRFKKLTKVEKFIRGRFTQRIRKGIFHFQSHPFSVVQNFKHRINYQVSTLRSVAEFDVETPNLVFVLQIIQQLMLK
ncbi:hypothetical protein QVD17_05110 [Tagetes erecta]|uniref:Uncharacterized protein n=1 Tax=Tagetes erecta TaxID=13708 RepID=A0AAD8PAX9_TARER|nr:hypothetical protein QVD17_05110 [Tagetes erecta]